VSVESGATLKGLPSALRSKVSLMVNIYQKTHRDGGLDNYELVFYD
jgi:hypothetical protein